MVSAVEMAVNPKKRVFLALVLFSAIVTAASTATPRLSISRCLHAGVERYSHEPASSERGWLENVKATAPSPFSRAKAAARFKSAR